MLDDFLNGEMFIRISAGEINRLPELDRKIGLKWKSGDRINSLTTEGYLQSYGTIYIRACRPQIEGGNRIYYKRSSQLNDTVPCVTLDQFLDYKPIEIQEDEFKTLFEVNENDSLPQV